MFFCFYRVLLCFFVFYRVFYRVLYVKFLDFFFLVVL